MSRAVAAASVLLVAAVYPALPHAQGSGACIVGGTITSGRTPIPGVVVSVVDAQNKPLDVSSSGPDGTYALRLPGPAEAGHYVLKAEFVAFAPLSRDLTIDQTSCQQRVDLTMTLASRAPKPAAVAVPAAPAPPLDVTNVGRRGQAGTPGGRQGGGRGAAGRGQAPAQQFQSLELLADQAGLARADDGAGNANDSAAQVLLPPGFSPDTSAESVTSIGGTTGRSGWAGWGR